MVETEREKIAVRTHVGLRVLLPLIRSHDYVIYVYVQSDAAKTIEARPF